MKYKSINILSDSKIKVRNLCRQESEFVEPPQRELHPESNFWGYIKYMSAFNLAKTLNEIEFIQVDKFYPKVVKLVVVVEISKKI